MQVDEPPSSSNRLKENQIPSLIANDKKGQEVVNALVVLWFLVVAFVLVLGLLLALGSRSWFLSLRLVVTAVALGLGSLGFLTGFGLGLGLAIARIPSGRNGKESYNSVPSGTGILLDRIFARHSSLQVKGRRRPFTVPTTT